MSNADLFDASGKIKSQYGGINILAKGVATLVAGTVTVSIPGLAATDVVLLTIYSPGVATETVIAEIAPGSLNIVSDDVGSTKQVAYLAIKA